MASASISKSVVWQLGGKLSLEGIAFFSIPIFTRLLTPEDYGFFALYISWLSIFVLVIGLSVNGSIGNARIKFDSKDFSAYLSSVLTISFISFVIVTVAVILLGSFLEILLKIRKSYIILLCVHSFSLFVLNFEITRLDQLKKVECSTVLSFCYSIICVSVSLLLVILIKDNRGCARIYGQAIPTIVFGFIIFFFVYIRGKKAWNTIYAKYCLSFTIPIVFHKIGHLIFSQSDKIMLQRMIGNEILGIYSVAFSLCSVLSMIYGALNVAWSPFYYDFKRHNKNEDIIIHSRRYIKFFTSLTIGFVLLAYDVYRIIAPSVYYNGVQIIPFFVVSNYFSFLYLFPVNFEFYNARTKLIPVATFSAALLNVIINFLLIPRYGIAGAAISTLTSHIVLFVFHEIVARFIIKEFECPWHIYILGIVMVFIACLLSVLLKTLPVVRWCLFILVSLCLLKDLLKNKAII